MVECSAVVIGGEVVCGRVVDSGVPVVGKAVVMGTVSGTIGERKIL